MNESDREVTVKVKKKWLYILITIVALCWGLYWILVCRHIGSWAERGQFGDLFGGLNALFSGMAFAVLIYAIYLQHEELRLQRIELKLTREELAGQKNQLKKQNETLQKQNFDSAFFQLLRFHNEILNSMDFVIGLNPKRQITKTGRDCFLQFHLAFKSHYNANETGNANLERIKNTYMAFFEKHQSDVGHYFRNLYNIIKFIEFHSVENKNMYANLVRAQLSSYELSMLFYNALSPLGCEKFKPLIEKYALLKNMPDNVLITTDHKQFYDEHAFGGHN